MNKIQKLLLIYEEDTFVIGKEFFIDSVAKNNNAVVFEDDKITGYFYAIDMFNNENILDALHIYNVDNISDKNIPSNIKILWNEDESKVFLSINNYYHAVFDFKARAGYCRNAFPEKSKEKWNIIKERKLTDSLIEILSSN